VDGGGLTDQHKEGGLEGVLDVLAPVEETAADRPHQPAVPLHQRGERGLVVVSDVAAEQLGVGQIPAGQRAGEVAQVVGDGFELSCGHGSRPPEEGALSLLVHPAAGLVEVS
jgi:hypothetical protein